MNEGEIVVRSRRPIAASDSRSTKSHEKLREEKVSVVGVISRTVGFSKQFARNVRFQNTFRCCTFSLLASANLGSTTPFPETNDTTWAPTAGPCLNPCPEPPPTSHTFSNSGWRSSKKSPFEVFSYWQTLDSIKGASKSSGKRRAR